MRLINKEIKTTIDLYNITNFKKDFDKSNYLLGVQRVRVLSLALSVIAFLYLYADLVVFKNVPDKVFRVTLCSTHLISVGISIIFLLCYKKLIAHNNEKENYMWVIRGYIFISLLMAAVASVNSQRLTGNIDAYVVAVLILTVAFPIEPIFMLFTLISNHVFFIIGITMLSKDPYMLFSKQLNSTAMVVGAFIFCYSLYRYRLREFISDYKLEESKNNFKKVFDLNPLPMFIASYEDGKIIVANDKAHEFYGYSREEFQQIYASELYVDKTDRKMVLNKLDNSVRAENYIVEHQTSLGIKKWVIANYEAIEYMGEKCVLTNVTDITELKRLENELLAHASTDMMTGVLNRRKGIEALKEVMNSKDSTTSSVCFIDIDGLKDVNDKFGHNEGDYLINTVCRVIKDSISDTDMIFRFGGDEFVILLPDKTEAEGEKLWNEIQSKFTKINNSGHKPYNIITSHGLVEFSSNSTLSVDELLDLADKKMYVEKRQHKSNPS